MPAATRRLSALTLFSTLLLAGCGSTQHVVCPATSSECGCGGNVPCVAPQYLFATNTSGQVALFPVDYSTGALGTPATASGPTAGLGIAALGGQFLYASDFQTAQIYGWTIGANGSLSVTPGSPFTTGPLSVPGGLAADATGEMIYAAGAGTITGYAVNSMGALNSTVTATSGLNFFLTLDPADQYLFASVDEPPGSIAAFTVDSTTGALSSVAGSPFAADPNNASNCQPGQIVVDPSGNYVYVPLYATNQVAAFSIVKPAGTLTPVPGSPFAAGEHPESIIAVNNLLYVGNFGDDTLSGYSIDASTGVLTPLAGSPFQVHGAQMVSDPLGRYLYITGAGGIQVFSIDPTTGALTPIAGSPFPHAGVTLMTYSY
jgi:6-phosphogluconolactonase